MCFTQNDFKEDSMTIKSLKQKLAFTVSLLATLIVATSCGVNLFAPFAYATRTDAEGLTERADSLYLKGEAHYEEALELYEEALAEDSTYAGALRGRAKIRLDLASTNTGNFLLEFATVFEPLLGGFLGGEEDTSTTNTNSTSNDMFSMIENIPLTDDFLEAVALSLDDLQTIPTSERTEADRANISVLQVIDLLALMKGVAGDLGDAMTLVTRINTAQSNLNYVVDNMLVAELKGAVSNMTSTIADGMETFGNIMDTIDELGSDLSNIQANSSNSDNFVSVMVGGLTSTIYDGISQATNSFAIPTMDTNQINSMLAASDAVDSVLSNIDFDSISAGISNGTISNSDVMEIIANSFLSNTNLANLDSNILNMFTNMSTSTSTAPSTVTVNITSPTNNQTITNIPYGIMVSVGVPTNKTVTNLVFKVNSVVLTNMSTSISGNTTTITYPWTGTNGTYSLVVDAQVNDGAVVSSSTVSATISTN